MSLFAMPDGRRFHSVNVKQYYVLGNRIVILSHDNSNNNNVLGRSNNNGTLYNYNAGDNTTALFIQNQIDAAMLSTSTSVIIISKNPVNDVALTWVSITPGTGTDGAGYSGVITGTGFTPLTGVLSMGVDDGAGHQFLASSSVVINDTTIDLDFTTLTPAGTYMLYYGVTGGATNNTGLVIVVS